MLIFEWGAWQAGQQAAKALSLEHAWIPSRNYRTRVNKEGVGEVVAWLGEP